MLPLTLRELTLADYDAVLALWNATPGVRANETRDEIDSLVGFQRNGSVRLVGAHWLQ